MGLSPLGSLLDESEKDFAMNNIMTDELLTLPAAGPFDPEFARLLDHLTERLIAGECLDLEALAREHREHAESLRELVPAMQAVAQLAQPEPDAAPAQKLPLRAPAEGRS